MGVSPYDHLTSLLSTNGRNGRASPITIRPVDQALFQRTRSQTSAPTRADITRIDAVQSSSIQNGTPIANLQDYLQDTLNAPVTQKFKRHEVERNSHRVGPVIKATHQTRGSFRTSAQPSLTNLQHSTNPSNPKEPTRGSHSNIEPSPSKRTTEAAVENLSGLFGHLLNCPIPKSHGLAAGQLRRLRSKMGRQNIELSQLYSLEKRSSDNVASAVDGDVADGLNNQQLCDDNDYWVGPNEIQPSARPRKDELGLWSKQLGVEQWADGGGCVPCSSTYYNSSR
eukprot:GHVH01002649.1.p2 GENE.GHVH01002649.1~~GHVH01002649.1.p2  ORF type:complete len:282 (+),score=34.51 GHVH01002649.1:1196-2041(+)